MKEMSGAASPTGTHRFKDCMTWLARLDGWLSLVDRQLLCWGIIGMAVNTIANVIARLFFSSSLFFSEELNQFLIILVTFVGISEAARMGRHIRISVFTDMLGRRAAKAMLCLIGLVTASLLFLLCHYSINYIENLHAMNRLTPSLRIPVYLTYLWVPLGLAMTGFQFLMGAIANAAGSGVYLSYKIQDIYHGENEPKEPRLAADGEG